MKRVIVTVLVALLAFSGIAYATETVAPTLTDVIQAITELRADVAELKADGFTKATKSGKLAVATTDDKLVSIEVTSILAGPDATVIGVLITNKSDKAHVRMQTLIDTSVVAGSKSVEIIDIKTDESTVLPGTTGKVLILLDPLPMGAKDVTLRTSLYDDKTWDTIIEPTMSFAVEAK